MLKIAYLFYFNNFILIILFLSDFILSNYLDTYFYKNNKKK